MGKLIDLTGQRFGFWLVQNIGNKQTNGQTQWNCICECGIQKLVTSNSLRGGNSTSCGCNHTPDLTNKIFGKLLVLNLIITADKSRRFWLCQCQCGKNINVSTYKLREKLIESCGCNITQRIKETSNNGDLLSELIKNIITKFSITEEIIINSKKLSDFMSSAIIKKEFKELKVQIDHIININADLQKSIVYLSTLKPAKLKKINGFIKK
jgi:hypothetical protein